MATSFNLYALLVGIDQYERVTPLHGCINDVRNVEAYLNADPDFAAEAKAIQMLTNEAATKQAIINGFREHLAQATAADTVLFYFSGYGTQEEADPALWPNEANGRLECLVCYDGPVDLASAYLMTDKEIRYLINELSEKTGAHVVTIFDCGHSGDTSRNVGRLAPAEWTNTGLALERRLPNVFPKRTFSEFLFSDTITEEALREHGPEKLVLYVPTPTHELTWRMFNLGFLNKPVTPHRNRRYMQYRKTHRDTNLFTNEDSWDKLTEQPDGSEDVDEVTGEGVDEVFEMDGDVDLGELLPMSSPPPPPLAPSPGPVILPSVPPPPASPFRAGSLDYDLPQEMPVGTATVCTVRIAGAEVPPDSFKISAGSTSAAVRLTDEMSVELIDGSAGANFGIQVLGSSVRQAIITGEPTEWRFSVTPRQNGRFPLTLTITAHFNGKSKVVLSLDKPITTATTAGPAIVTFISQPISEPSASTSVSKRKILFLSANPAVDSLARLRIDTESRRILEELDKSKGPDKYDYMAIAAVTPQFLTWILLKEKPYILHFSGHGTSDGLYLVDDAEAPVLASTEALGDIFSVLGEGVACLVLNACYSVSQAEVLARFIPQVVATSAKVGDKAALRFSVGFYQAIGAGQPFPSAFKLGRGQVRLGGGLSADDVFILLPKT